MTSKDVDYVASDDSNSSSSGCIQEKSDTLPSTGLSQDVELVILSSGASTPSKSLMPGRRKVFGIKRKQTRTSFATPRKLFQPKRTRRMAPEDSGHTPSAETPTSSQAPESPVSSASKKLSTSFLKKEDRVTDEISVRDPQLKEQVVTVSEVRCN